MAFLEFLHKLAFLNKYNIGDIPPMFKRFLVMLMTIVCVLIALPVVALYGASKSIIEFCENNFEEFV